MQTYQNGSPRLIDRGLNWFSRRRLAQVSGVLPIQGVRERVEIIRDRWGAAHIYAVNEHDLYFAQGFAHAQDRFFQMEFQRRLAAGRLSEIFGSPALFADRWMRVLGLRQSAEAAAARLEGPEWECLEAYTAGVNAFLSLRRLPVEFDLLHCRPEPWQPADSLAWYRALAWMLSANWECELFRQMLIDRLGAEAAAELDLSGGESWPLVLGLTNVLGLEQQLTRLGRAWTGPGAREGVGSNNWAVAGWRSESGMPVLANDMHLMLGAPAVWYENHLVCGDLNVTGISTPGAPLVVAGHNGKVAWGFTAGYADVQDLYEERLRRTPDGAVEYEFQGQWLPAEVRREEIRVRGGTSYVQEVIITHHGPVISGLVEAGSQMLAGGQTLSLRWAALAEGGNALRALRAMNRAANCTTFRQALADWSAPVVNVIYADTGGNIAYSLAGQIPIRAAGDGSVPAPGWSGDYEWTGFIPPEELPHLYNPEQGYLASANNRIAGPEYPYFLGRDYVNAERAERIVELILRRPKVDAAYFQKMQFDQVSPFAQMLAVLVGQLDSSDPRCLANPRLGLVIELMRRWDGTMAADRPQPLIAQRLTGGLLALIFENRLGDLMPWLAGRQMHPLMSGSLWGRHAQVWLRRELLRPYSPWFDQGSGEGRDDLLMLALQRALGQLVNEQGPEIERWEWGRSHTVTFTHQLGRVRPLDRVFNRGPYPIGGDENTVWAAVSLSEAIDANAGMVGPPYRFIADLSDLDHALGLLAPGNSGQPASPHYDDQLESWFSGGYHPLLFRREDVLREQEAVLELIPTVV